MSKREVLAAALEIFYTKTPEQYQPEDFVKAYRTIAEAARKYLAQLPEKCGSCGGDGEIGDVPPDMDQLNIALGHFDVITCPHCIDGKVYPAELVERIARSLFGVTWKDEYVKQVDYRWEHLFPFHRNEFIQRAVAVLDALNGETQ